MSQALPRQKWKAAIAIATLGQLERAPMRKFDVNVVALDALLEHGFIETYATDVGAVWVRISDAGRAALGATRIKVNT